MRRIFSETQALGLPEPVEIGMRVRLTIYLADPMLLLAAKDSEKEKLAAVFGNKSVSGELDK